MKNNINLLNKNYEIIDTVDYITIPDSFIYRHNKTGIGNGEAKLYIGNESDRLFHFWGDLKKNNDCFFLKEDLLNFLEVTKSEYTNHQQEYALSTDRTLLLEKLKNEINILEDDMLNFSVYRVNVQPPRVYINSEDPYYTLMRKLGLVNLTYLSVMKLKRNNVISYYFKLFFEYKHDVEKVYLDLEEKRELENIELSTRKSDNVKKRLIEARVGHGKYRENLIEELMYCPFTQVNDERILIASHIKPWSQSTDKEKTDPKNGFIFTPTFDTLFDRGFITFTDNRKLIVSNWMSPLNQKRLKIYTGKKIKLLPIDENRKVYLKYHREVIFKK